MFEAATVTLFLYLAQVLSGPMGEISSVDITGYGSIPTANTGGLWTMSRTDATPRRTKHFLIIRSPLGRNRYRTGIGVISSAKIAINVGKKGRPLKDKSMPAPRTSQDALFHHREVYGEHCTTERPGKRPGRNNPRTCAPAIGRKLSRRMRDVNEILSCGPLSRSRTATSQHDPRG